ncbi:MAG TPA: PKD domain-containing protein, partial [Pedobacter sp.]
IDANNIKAVPYPDRNSTYTWYADNIEIGTSITFPGYTISGSNQSVTIKLVAEPSQGCQPSEFSHVFSTNQSVAASYTQSATEGCGPLTVSFVNTSTSLTNATFRWDFGNGTTSSQTMPAAVTFQPDPTGKDTTYTVTLTATTLCGSNSITSTVFVKAKPISVFSPSRTTGCSPMTVTFSNTSPGGTNTYYYDFGDGTLLTKTDKSSVQHTYTTNVVKDFVVKMIAENECGRDESSYTIRVSPNTVLPELVVNADQKQGCAPFSVNFYNNSKGGNLFKYDFGDGATLLTRAAPEVVVHTFTAPGTYTITLTASNGCSDTTTTESVTVLEQPLTAFSADITLGCPGLPVQFRNTSVGGVSYIWDFGDGTTSNEFEPKHIFTGDQEYYTVSLTATNSLGCTATTTMNQYIHIVQPPVAQFNVAPSTLISIPDYTFRFEDESTNGPAIWAWDFGDGKTSILQNPSHTYPDTGKYVVTLRVTNQQGCFTTTFKTVTIVGVPGYLYVPNSFMPGSERPELRVFSAKGSGIKTWRMGIFNKWGQQLWETTKLNEGRPAEGWDGVFNSVPVPQGVYFWKIDVEFINGTAWKGMTYDSSAPKKTGVIHLLR